MLGGGSTVVNKIDMIHSYRDHNLLGKIDTEYIFFNVIKKSFKGLPCEYVMNNLLSLERLLGGDSI